jgi:Tfp pilus assembly protein PilN
MIQFNLLPDVKQEFIKVRRFKRLAMTGSTIVIAVSAGILIILIGVVDGIQKHTLSNLNSNISTLTSQINTVPDLNEILTIQNQLTSLPALDSQKPVAARIFNYLNEVTPSNVAINSLSLDFTADQMMISGSAPNVATIDQYVDTYKFTNYTTGNNTQPQAAFSNVVLSSYSTGSAGSSSDTGAGAASYSLTLNFNAALFNHADNTQLIVPNEISTRSVLDQPLNLFQPSTFNSSSTTNNQP